MKVKLIIAKLAQAKDFGEYMEFRITVSDSTIDMIRDIMGGVHWDLIKEKEAEYQDFQEWFCKLELN